MKTSILIFLALFVRVGIAVSQSLPLRDTKDSKQVKDKVKF